MKQVILYGLGGPRDNFRAFRYYIMQAEHMDVKGLKGAAEIMCSINPSIKTVYMVDNRSHLLDEYYASHNAKIFEPCMIFRDTLERDGIVVLIN